MNKQTTALNWVAFLGLLLGSVAVCWHSLVSTFRLAATDEEYTQILLILPVAVAFGYLGWKRVRPFIGNGNGWGLAFLCPAALLGSSSWLRVHPTTPDLLLSVQMLALLLWWIGSFVLCFGNKAARALLFPLSFLLWMVPLPNVALGPVVKFLQQGSALTSTLLFQAAGVPVAQDGSMISIPGLTVEVAKECSSIRSSLMLLVTTMVLAQLFLRSPVRKAWIIAASVPLSIAKNGLRIFVIAMLGTRVDPGYLNGRLHHQGGIVFFAIALVFIFLFLWLLQRGESRDLRKPAIEALASC